MSETERIKNEIRLAGLYDEDSDYNGLIGKALDELLDVFQQQGHSGFSAGLVSSIFYRLIKGETLTPLTGEPEEWTEVSKGLWQNKRCYRVFSEDGGKTGYDIDGKVFFDENGNGYTSKDSRVAVTFPYMPNTEYVREAGDE